MKRIPYGEEWYNLYIMKIRQHSHNALYKRISGPWQSIKRIIVEQQSTTKSFLHHLKISVGNGTKTRFWNDQWVGNYTLKDKFPALFSLSSQQTALISSIGWFEGHVWKWSLAWKRELAQQEVQLVEGLIAQLSAYQTKMTPCNGKEIKSSRQKSFSSFYIWKWQ